MGVEDHPVHEKTRQKEDARYGCFNREITSPGYMAPDRIYNQDGTYEQIIRFVPSVTSKLCRSLYQWDIDPKCKGCQSPRDLEYAERMKDLL